MQKEEAGLLNAIADQPDDDDKRMVYADWLDEYGGDPNRAELIRIQCGLERGNIDYRDNTKATAERLKDLQDRETELTNGGPGIREFVTTPEIAEYVAKYPYCITFNRGMIHHLYLANTHITELPPNLQVSGDLDLSGTAITELPADLRVGGNLHLVNTRITAEAARQLLTMQGLSDLAKITGLESAFFFRHAEEARRNARSGSGPGTPPRP